MTTNIKVVNCCHCRKSMAVDNARVPALEVVMDRFQTKDILGVSEEELASTALCGGCIDWFQKEIGGVVFPLLSALHHLEQKQQREIRRREAAEAAKRAKEICEADKRVRNTIGLKLDAAFAALKESETRKRQTKASRRASKNAREAQAADLFSAVLDRVTVA